MEATKKPREDRIERDEGNRHALCPVLLRYAIARQGDKDPQLLHVPLGFGEEALVMFSSQEKAQRYHLSRRHFLYEVFSEEWHTRSYSAGELISLLLGLCKGTKWVLLDPEPGVRFVASEMQEADFMSRARFVDQLFEYCASGTQAGPTILSLASQAGSYVQDKAHVE